jgi:predicted dinucleotide-utilizing enzyme
MNKTIAGAVVGVGLVGAGMFGAGTLVDNNVGAAEPELVKLQDGKIQETKEVIEVFDADNRIQQLQARRDIILIQIASKQAEVAKLEAQIGEINKVK